MAELIYLDNNATTRPLDEVVEAMLPLLSEGYANPSSVHRFGQSVRHQVERARGQVAQMIRAQPEEIVFTSGGTESINLALRGTLAQRGDRRHVVSSTVEHNAVHRLCRQLAREGYVVDEVGVDGEGRIDLAELEARVTPDTAIVSVMWANNETGALFDVQAVAKVAEKHGVPLHLDAIQAIGKLDVDVSAVPAQLVSISAHKFHGPKGAGSLFVRRRTRLRPLVIGGRQERDLRAGTENVAAIVGMGVAAEAVHRRPASELKDIQALRDRFEAGVLDAVEIARVNSRAAERIVNTSNIGFRGLQAQALLMLLSEQGICASAGAACSSGSLEPSHVLLAMGVDVEYAYGSLRFSLSHFTSDADVDRTIAAMPEIVARLSVLSGG